METGAITQYVDVAQVVLYIFWAFFAGLIYYLLRENHREGYPMDSGRENGPRMEGWPPVPEAKTYKLADGREMLSPDLRRNDGNFSGQPTHGWNGAPLEPVGNPLLAGVGPGAWTQRADIPDMLHEGGIKIVPLRIAGDHGVASQDTDPRGLPVYGADGERAGSSESNLVHTASAQIETKAAGRRGAADIKIGVSSEIDVGYRAIGIEVEGTGGAVGADVDRQAAADRLR